MKTAWRFRVTFVAVLSTVAACGGSGPPDAIGAPDDATQPGGGFTVDTGASNDEGFTVDTGASADEGFTADTGTSAETGEGATDDGDSSSDDAGTSHAAGSEDPTSTDVRTSDPETSTTTGATDPEAVQETAAPVACPAPTVNHAAVGGFDFRQRPIHSGEVANFVVAPSNPEVLYLGIEVNAHAVYRSDDGGRTWTVLHRFDHAKDAAIHPSDPDIAFHADSSGLWRTTTGRPDSYEQVLRGGFIGPPWAAFATVAISPSNPSIVYTAQKGMDGSGGGPEDDSEGSRNQLGAALRQVARMGLAEGGIVYRSDDGGDSFERVAVRTPKVNVLLVDPRDPDRVLMGSGLGIHESVDGGATWQAVSGTDGADDVVDLRHDGRRAWVAASADGVLRSTDGGRSWSLSTEGLPDTDVQRVGLAGPDSGVVWATTRSGVARSTDGGSTFADVSGLDLPDGLPASNLQALATWPTEPDHALVGTSSQLYSARAGLDAEVQGQWFGQGLFLTTDAGATWERVGQGLVENTLIDIEASLVHPGEVWTGQPAGRGVFRTRDAGRSWSQSNTYLTHYPMKIAATPGHPNRYAISSSHPEESYGVTSDSGVSWSTRSEQTFFNVLDDGLEYLDSSIRDHGNLHLHGIAIAPDDPNEVLVGSVTDPRGFAPAPLRGSHIFRSQDGGRTWEESHEGYDIGVTTSIHDIAYDPVDPSVVYLATTEQESIQGNGVWRSDDRGRSWTRLDEWEGSAASVNEVVPHPTDGRSVVAATGGGLYVSSDRGTTWVRTHEAYAWDAAADPAHPGVIYAGTVDGLLVSTDFGQTWLDIAPDWFDPTKPAWGLAGVDRTTGVTSVAVSCDGGIVYAGFAGVGMAVSTAPGYQPSDVDPDQVTTLSHRGTASRYDQELSLRRLLVESQGPSSTGEVPTVGKVGATEGLPAYAVDCAAETIGGRWAEIEGGATPTADEEAVIDDCMTSGGAQEIIDDRQGDGASGGPAMAPSGALLRDLPQPLVDCIVRRIGPGEWSTLLEGRTATPEEAEAISTCESSGGRPEDGSGSGGDRPKAGSARLGDLPPHITQCIRSDLPAGEWDRLVGGGDRTPDQQALIERCEASGGAGN